MDGVCFLPQARSQKAWLSAAKRSLTKAHPGLTWDEFSRLVGIDPRGFKTYRMPTESTDYRKMPPLVESKIKFLVDHATEPSLAASNSITSDPSLLVPALAALVVRQARISLIDGRMISGTSRSFGLPVGLASEDRKAMALVSRACLTLGLPDWGAEIHDLLWRCTQPFGEWLSVPEITEAGLESTCLIQAENGIPTAEAEELARGFSGLTAGIEEQLFLKFMEILARFPDERADEYYTAVRQFVVRHPVVVVESLRNPEVDLPSQLWMLLQQQFFEPVPDSWQICGFVQLCSHCGNAMKQGKAALVCRTLSCVASNAATPGARIKASELLRASRGVRQYWIEPGLDEIRLHDALIKLGISVELYPFRDRVDLAVGDIGMDLKSYASPETLGRRFKRSLGGLAHYPNKWIVIPDWLATGTPSYVARLISATDRKEVHCLTVDQVIRRFERGEAHHA